MRDTNRLPYFTIKSRPFLYELRIISNQVEDLPRPPGPPPSLEDERTMRVLLPRMAVSRRLLDSTYPLNWIPPALLMRVDALAVGGRPWED
jgi:hypothetical protein